MHEVASVKEAPARQSPGAIDDAKHDDAARRALAWLERGQPDAEIVYDEDAPKQTQEELAEFQPASLRKRPF